MAEITKLIQYSAEQVAAEVHSQIDGLDEVDESVDFLSVAGPPVVAAGVYPGVSDSDIIPEEYQNVLMQVSGTLTANYFLIGDVAEILIQRAAVQKLPVTAKRIYHAIGKYCGKSQRTVRYYHETARAFSKEQREEYYMLPFAHFVFARSSGELCQAILEYAMRKPWASVVELTLHRRALLQSPTPQGEDIPQNGESARLSPPVAKITPNLAPLTARYNPPPLSSYITKLSIIIENLEDLAKSVEISEPNRNRLLGYADQARELLGPIQEDVQAFRLAHPDPQHAHS